MKSTISRLLEHYETGRMSRRDLVQGLTVLADSPGAARAAGFQGNSINHISLYDSAPLLREPFICFIWFHLVPSASGANRLADTGGPGPPPWQICTSFIARPLARCVGIPLIPTLPGKIFLRVFYRLPSAANSILQKPCFDYGQGQESAAEPPHQGSRPLASNPRQLVCGLPKLATAVSKSALIPRKLSSNKPGPWQGYSLEGAPSNYQSLCEEKFHGGGPKPITDN